MKHERVYITNKDKKLEHTSFNSFNLFEELLHVIRITITKNNHWYCDCGGNLKTLSTTDGDPEGIRQDRQCKQCGQVWGVTKAHKYKI